jgi:hypothetical protein
MLQFAFTSGNRASRNALLSKKSIIQLSRVVDSVSYDLGDAHMKVKETEEGWRKQWMIPRA